MGLWEFLRQWRRGRLVAGILASLVIHVLLAVAALWGLDPELTKRLKPGDALIVELPNPDEPAPAGTPTPTPPATPPSPPVAAKPSPPPPRHTPPPPRQVAAAPRPPEPRPKAAEPAPRAAEPAPKAAETAPPAAEPAPKAAEPAPRAATEPAAAEPPRAPGDRQIASLPPGPPSASDVRAALRRGAGGRTLGRGGIEGEPIPLDSPDPRFNEYLEQVRRRIKEKWGFPCVKNPQTHGCDHHSTMLIVEFGILKDGRVQFTDVVRVSDHRMYDEYAVNAILMAQPYPPVPAAMMGAMKAGSSGLAIRAQFSYVVESSLTKILR